MAREGWLLIVSEMTTLTGDASHVKSRLYELLKFQKMTHGFRNSIEPWFGIINRRTRRFHDSFPHRSGFESSGSWTQTFVSFYNLERPVHLSEDVLS